jgi:hypothetical protein
MTVQIVWVFLVSSLEKKWKDIDMDRYGGIKESAPPVSRDLYASVKPKVV